MFEEYGRKYLSACFIFITLVCVVLIVISLQSGYFNERFKNLNFLKNVQNYMDSDSIFYGELSTLKRQRSIYNDNENVTLLDYSDAVTEELDVQRNIGKSAKFLIYKCVSSCGGLGDRLRGIVNSYVMARITGRTFGIIHKVPCELSKFLKPNKYDWRIDPKHFRNKSSKVYSVMDSVL